MMVGLPGAIAVDPPTKKHGSAKAAFPRRRGCLFTKHVSTIRGLFSIQSSPSPSIC